MAAPIEASGTPAPKFRQPQIGSRVDGTITKIINHAGCLVDIGTCEAFLPKEYFGKGLRRPHVGYRLAMLEIIDVDLDAQDSRKVILNGEDCINLTPSPLLLSPAPSARASPAPSRGLSPVTSHRPSPHSSPALSAQGDPPMSEPEPLSLDGPVDLPESKLSRNDRNEAHAPSQNEYGTRDRGSFHKGYQRYPDVPRSDTSISRDADRVLPLRKALVNRARELGVSVSQLAPVLHSLDILELQLALMDKARELGVDHSKLSHVIQSIGDITEVGLRGPSQPQGLSRAQTMGGRHRTYR